METNSLSPYYSLTKVLSHNAILNLIIGKRGCGKTYAFKQKAYTDWLKSKSEWVYVRRYDDELKTKATFWNDFQPLFDDGYELKIVGYKCFIRERHDDDKDIKDKKSAKSKGWTSDEQSSEEAEANNDEWLPFGYFIALSDQQKYKSSSFPMVTTIAFDEFIIENQSRRYLSDEVGMFIGLYDTISRGRLVKALMISNSGFLNNPYFIEYDVKYSELTGSKSGITRKNKGSVVIELVRDVEGGNRSYVNSIAPESYVNYASDNTFMDYDNCRIEEKPDGCKYVLSITNGDRYLSFHRYYDLSDRLYVTTKKRDSNLYEINAQISGDNPVISADFLKVLKLYHKKALISFVDIRAKHLFLDMIKP